MRLGIIIDSSSGITKEEANKKGWEFLPIIVTIDGKDYKDGIDINSKDYYKMINIEMEVKTATTPLGEVDKLLKNFSNNYDYVIVYPLSMELSSQFNNCFQISKSLPNVFIVPSEGVGTSIVSDCEILEKMAENGSSWEKIKNHALELTKSQFGLCAPRNMKWLVKGGRISGTAASMAKLIKIIPIIQIKNGKLEKFGKGRIFEKTILKITRYLKENFYEKNKNYKFTIYHGGDENLEKITKDISLNLPISDISYFPPVIGNHVGPDVIAIIAHLKS